MDTKTTWISNQTFINIHLALILKTGDNLRLPKNQSLKSQSSVESEYPVEGEVANED
jgi:hypothetical protein